MPGLIVASPSHWNVAAVLNQLRENGWRGSDGRRNVAAAESSAVRCCRDGSHRAPVLPAARRMARRAAAAMSGRPAIIRGAEGRKGV